MPKKFRSIIGFITCALILAFGVSIVNAAQVDIKKQNTQSKQRPAKTVFDLGHSEIFSPVNDGELHYSQFYNSFKAAGETVSVNKETITAKTLKGVKTYIFAGPAAKPTDDEVAALKDYVEGGGHVLIMLHISKPMAWLSENFGIFISNFVISEPADTIEKQSQDFYVSRFTPHPVTAGLDRIAVFGTWGLMVEGNAKIIARTSDAAWADLNRNRAFEKGEPVQSFGIAAVCECGKGKVIVVADDAPFANKFITRADNTAFAENIIKWLAR